jgi:CheY-like chemotaxis protein
MDGTVLVADDDRTIRTVLTQALTRAGCKVHATSSLTTLMRWVGRGQGRRGDLGRDHARWQRAGDAAEDREDRPGLPVIVISAQNTIMTAIQAAEAEAYDYLPKPFDLPDLMKRTARALEVAPRARSAAENRRTPRRSAAGRAHAGDAGALPAGGAGDEHRSAGADHRRIAAPANPDRPRDPRFLRPAHAALRDVSPPAIWRDRRPGAVWRACKGGTFCSTRWAISMTRRRPASCG